MRPADPDSEFSTVFRYIREVGEPVSLPSICEATGLNQKKVSRILWHYTQKRKVQRTGTPRNYLYSPL